MSTATPDTAAAAPATPGTPKQNLFQCPKWVTLVQPTDDPLSLFPLGSYKGLVDDQIDTWEVTFKARDQAWGPCKSRVVLRIMTTTPSGVINTDADLGAVTHEWTDFRWVWDASKLKINPGDKFEFMGVVGGGGGMCLIVSEFNSVLTYAATGRRVEIVEGPTSVHFTTSSDDAIPLWSYKYNCEANSVPRVKATWRAKDQGWGNLKGKLYLHVTEAGVARNVDMHPDTVPHEWTDMTFTTPADFRVAPNGSVEFYCSVGGGGGHELFVENFRAEITVQAPQGPEMAASSH
ncbi:hypothetical protein Pelo_10848 [Pelomyxa schiedti]|nr:hypothetical protein Pelo_10848 [Pelomyxa schiedti]